ncbi:hypothetical protein Tco_1434052, partial [Tanacetum coccineum]
GVVDVVRLCVGSGGGDKDEGDDGVGGDDVVMFGEDVAVDVEWGGDRSVVVMKMVVVRWPESG